MKKHEPKIQAAIEILLANDAVLFQNDTAERAITAKFACYIQEQFPDWDVDCEYNRNFNGIKRLKEICNPSNNEYGATVYPDITVHRRMTSENFLVIEVKKNNKH
ncbi:MAG: hypothetical protein AB2614_01185 [Candidatus Thiodiazotropha endolucinida]